MQYNLFKLILDIRGKSLTDLSSILVNKLNEELVSFTSNDRLRLHQQNKYYIHQLLARITDYVETSSDIPSRFNEYIAEGKNRYEIEHIWANHPERHTDEFSHASDFSEYRNRIGGLLLLPKSFNGSYNDSTYSEKLPHYFGQNLLAKTLHVDCYNHNPGFIRFKNESGLAFKAHPEFKKKDLDERQVLYRQIAERLWSSERLQKVVQG